MLGRAIQLTLVRNKKKADGENRPIIDLDNLDYEQLGQIAKDTVKVGAIAVVGIGAAFFVMSTAQKIIVNLTNPANYR